MPDNMENEQGGLQDRLRHFGEEPDGHIWEAIESNLAKRRKKRPVFWWLAAGTLLLGLSLFSLVKWMEPSTPMVATETGRSQSENHSSIHPEGGREKLAEQENHVQNEIKAVEQGTESKQKSLQDKPEIIADEPSENQAERNKNITQKAKEKSRLASISTLPPLANHSRKKGENFGKNRKSELDRNRNQTTASHPVLKQLNEQIARKKQDRQLPEKARPVSEAVLAEVVAEKEFPVTPKGTKMGDEAKMPLEKTVEQVAVEQHPVSIQAGADSAKILAVQPTEKLADSSAVEKEINGNKVSHRLRFQVFAGARISVFRSLDINQTQTEKHLKLNSHPTPVANRLAYDLGTNIQYALNTRISMLGMGGISFLGERLEGSKEVFQTGSYDLNVEGNELGFKPIYESEKTSLVASQLAMFYGIGVSWQVFRGWEINGGLVGQWPLYQRLERTYGVKKEWTEEKFSMANPDLSFKIGVQRKIPIGHGYLGLEPTLQWFTKPVFRYDSGNRSTPVYSGLQVSYEF